VTSNPERRQRTREAIIAAAGACFAESGFNGTTLTDVQVRAGVSRGALYHHFASKEAVMEAVFERASTHTVEVARVAALAPSAMARGPLAALVAGCVAWLDAATQSDLGVVLLREGPASLGWERARSIEEGHSLGLVHRGLHDAHAAGEVAIEPTVLASRMISAMLAEAATAVLAAPTRHQRRTLQQAATVVVTLIEGFRVG
jgi:AcrR family transcriptional regulator